MQTDKSTVKNVRGSILLSFPELEPVIDDIIPKKSIGSLMKLKENDKAELFIIDNEVIAFKKIKKWVPVLKIIHKCKITRPKSLQVLSSRRRSHPLCFERGSDHVQRIHESGRESVQSRERGNHNYKGRGQRELSGNRSTGEILRGDRQRQHGNRRREPPLPQR